MNEAVFKTTVMGGFNKSEVLAFIDKQDEQYKEREKDLAARIDSLSTGLKNETRHSEELTKKVSELEEALSAEAGKNTELIEKLQAANIAANDSENSYSKNIEERDTEIKKLRFEVERQKTLQKSAEEKAEQAAAYAGELENKLALIDKTQEQIGRALLEAQQTADKIINTAQDDSNSILDKAKSDADILISEAREKVSRINHEAETRLVELLSSVSDYKARVTNTRENISNFFGAVDSVFESMLNNSEDILKTYQNAFNPEAEANIPVADATENEAATVKFDFSSND